MITFQHHYNSTSAHFSPTSIHSDRAALVFWHTPRFYFVLLCLAMSCFALRVPWLGLFHHTTPNHNVVIVIVVVKLYREAPTIIKFYFFACRFCNFFIQAFTTHFHCGVDTMRRFTSRLLHITITPISHHSTARLHAMNDVAACYCKCDTNSIYRHNDRSVGLRR